jgi:hypothetical protein
MSRSGSLDFTEIQYFSCDIEALLYKTAVIYTNKRQDYLYPLNLEVQA